MHARWYDEEIGHFISGDTIVADFFNPQAHNRYSYTYNDPLNYTDPSGHFVFGLNSYLTGVAGGLLSTASSAGGGISQTVTGTNHLGIRDGDGGVLAPRPGDGDILSGCGLIMPLCIPPTPPGPGSPPWMSYAVTCEGCQIDTEGMGATRDWLQSFGWIPEFAINIVLDIMFNPAWDFTPIGGVGGTAKGAAKFGLKKGLKEYAAPTIRQIPKPGNLRTIVFKSEHVIKHLDKIVADQKVVEAAINADIQKAAQAANSTGHFWGQVTVKGQAILYKAFTRADGVISVGTYFPSPY